MNKVVINNNYGGFCLSDKALDLYKQMAGVDYDLYKQCRHDPILVKVVEELGEKASDECSCLIVEEIQGNKYLIEEYDGMEYVVEPDALSWITID